MKHGAKQLLSRHCIRPGRFWFPPMTASMAPVHAVNSVFVVPSRHVSIGPQVQSAAHFASSAEHICTLHAEHAWPTAASLLTGSDASQVMGTPPSTPEPPLPSSPESGDADEGPEVLVHPCAAIAAIAKPR